MTRTALNPHSVGIPPKRDEPKDRPIAKYENGQLFNDYGGVYHLVGPEALRVLRWSLSHYPESHAQRIKDIDKALEAHSKEKA